MAYALGTHALAICERCGFQIKYLDLATEWNGVRVCSECFEEKHPQLEPSPVKADAEALYQPSRERKMALEVFTGRIFPPVENNVYGALALVGEVTIDFTLVPVSIAFTVSSEGGTGSVGDVTLTGLLTTVDVTGVSGTGGVGTVTVSASSGANVSVNVTGLAGTGSVGDVTVVAEANVDLTGVTSTASMGTVTVTGIGNVPVTGLAATGSVGDAAVVGKANVTISGAAGATASNGTTTQTFPVSVSVTGIAGTGAVGTQTNLIYGANLVTNGDGTNTTGWTPSANGTVTANQGTGSGQFLLTSTTTTNNVTFSRNITTTIGQTYQINGTVRCGTTFETYFVAYGTTTLTTEGTTSTSDTAVQDTFVADSTSTTIFCQIDTLGISGRTGYFDNIIVRLRTT